MFLCAGSSRPRYFIDDDADDLENAMKNAYWVQAYSAHVRISLQYASAQLTLLQAGIKKMVRQKAPGKIAFVGSTLSYMSFAGYNNYSPGKHALRGKRRSSFGSYLTKIF